MLATRQDLRWLHPSWSDWLAAAGCREILSWRAPTCRGGWGCSSGSSEPFCPWRTRWTVYVYQKTSSWTEAAPVWLGQLETNWVFARLLPHSWGRQSLLAWVQLHHIVVHSTEREGVKDRVTGEGGEVGLLCVLLRKADLATGWFSISESYNKCCCTGSERTRSSKLFLLHCS